MEVEFRPFHANYTGAFVVQSGHVAAHAAVLARRDRIMMQDTCRERVAAAAQRAAAHGFHWNCLGCVWPSAWQDSDFSQLLLNYSLLTGVPYQRAAQKIMMRHDDHATHAARRRSMCAQQDNVMLRHLACDGYFEVDNWGLPPALVDELAREVTAKLDAAQGGYSGWQRPWVATAAKLDALESEAGRRFWQNSTLLRAAVEYLGTDAQVVGYSALRLNKELKEAKQYVSAHWHHDRCGTRLKAFLYLHDVSKQVGRPMAIIPGTHNTLFWSYHTLDESRFRKKAVETAYPGNYQGKFILTGSKGGGFVFDTNSLHHNLIESSGNRTVVILEISNARKDAELFQIGKQHHSKLGFPCGAQANGASVRLLVRNVSELLAGRDAPMMKSVKLGRGMK